MKKYQTTLLAALITQLLAAGVGQTKADTNSPPQDAAAAVLQLQEQLDQQTKRIDRLYSALGPQLAEMEERAAELEKQAREDKALAMERVWESEDNDFTGRAECSPTEPSFAAVAKDGSIRLCDLDGKLLQSLRYEKETVTAVAYGPVGSRLLAGTKSGKVLLWELKSAAVRAVAQMSYPIERVAWLGTTGRALACSMRGDRVNGPAPEEMSNVQGDVFEIEPGKSVWKFTGWQHLDYQNVAVAPNNEWIAVLKIVKERGAYLLDAGTGNVIGSLINKDAGGLSVAVSPDSRLVAVGNPGVFLWDVRKKEMIRHLEGHDNWVVALAFSADGQRLISGAGDSTARVWDVKTGNEVGRLRFTGSSTYVHSVGFSCDGKRVLAAVEGGQLIIARAPAMVSATESK